MMTGVGGIFVTVCLDVSANFCDNLLRGYGVLVLELRPSLLSFGLCSRSCEL